MKKTIIVTICLVIISCAKGYAQDIITTKDAQKISAKIIEVSNKEIKYKKANNPDGPTFVINQSDVKSILYESGEYSSFDNNQQYNNDYDDDTRPFIKGARFNCYPEWTTIVGNDLGECFSWTFGVRIFDYGFIGAGVGVVEWLYDDWVSIPFTFNVRGFIPINRNVHPFMELTIGKTIGLTAEYSPTKLMVGMGFDFARFSLGFGYARYTADIKYYNYYSNTIQEVKSNNFYLKLGIKIGKRE